MKFENVKTEGMKQDYKVILSAEEIEEGVNKAIARKAKTFKKQGFRPGHVPLDIVRKNVEHVVLQEVFDSLISNASSNIVKKLGDIDMATKPTYRFESNYEKGKDVVLTISFETAPTFELKEFKGKITKITPLISDEEVKETREVMMKNNPLYEKAENDYFIQPGDRVNYFAQCFVNGVESRKKSFENFVIIPEKIPEDAEFLNGFIGKKAKESFDFTPATDKNLTYKFKIKSIKKLSRNLSLEEYASKMGFKNVEELNQLVKESLENRIKDLAFLYHKQQILENLGKEYNFDLPESIVAQETKNVVANIKRELEREKRAGIAEEADLKKTDDDFAKEYADLIRKRVLLGYILNKLSKQLHFSASNEELRSAIAKEVSQNPQHASQIVSFYSNNADALNYKKAEIIEKKVIEYLINKSETEELQKNWKETQEIVNKALED